MKLIVTQHGARHRYAIPKLLEEAGMLEALYTDSTAYSRVGKAAVLLSSLGIRSRSISVLSRRIPQGVPPAKIFSSDRLLFSGRFGFRSQPGLSGSYKAWGLRNADMVYSMYGEDMEFLQEAKAQGLKILVDVFVHPSTNRIVEAEAARYGRESDSTVPPEVEDNHSRAVFELADLLLCPSQWVADGVCEFAPQHREKVRVVQYGSSLQVRDSINENPTPGRILFAGREPLRKGLHHLAEAAAAVRSAGHKIDVRAAGVDQASISWMPHANEINCLGTLPMDQMHKEFEQADMFVLPSLSEGQAGVLLEAMASGCPVIATRESGVDFEAGCGITVPRGNPDALAQAVLGLLGNRDRRNQVARGALRQARMFSMEAWKARLKDVIEDAAAL